MKRLFHCIITGIGVTVGISIGKSLLDVFQNPVKRTKMKKKFTNIKNELFSNEEN